MTRIVGLITCLCLGWATLGFAQSKQEAIETAQQALGEGLPDIAVISLRKALQRFPNDADLELVLAQSLVAAGEGAAALQVISGLKSQTQTSQMLLGQAYSLQSQWQEAERAFNLVREASPHPEEADFYSAEAARMQGKWTEAVPIFENLKEHSKNWGEASRRRLAIYYMNQKQPERAAKLLENAEIDDAESAVLKARLAGLNGDYERAQSLVKELEKEPRGLTPEIVAAACVVNAEALVHLGKKEEARKALEKFIQDSPSNPFVGQVINQLVLASKSDAETALNRWAHEPPELRQGEAALALAKLRADAGNSRESVELLNEFNRPPLDAHPSRPEALRKLIALKTSAKDWQGALAAVELLSPFVSASEQAELIQIKAKIAAERGDFTAAAALYVSIGSVPGISQERGAYFKTLATLWSGRDEDFSSAYQTFKKQFPDSTSLPSLLLDRGLFFAGKKDHRAMEALKQYVTEFPDNPRADEARVALAELALNSETSDSAAALEWLSKVRSADSSAKEKADYLRVWIAADKDADDPAAAKAFIARWPQSAMAPMVFLKLGEIYFQKGDFAAAQAAFEKIGTQFPEHPLAARADYLTGLSMLKTMNPSTMEQAILTLERASRKDPGVLHPARLAQAEAYVAQDRGAEAIVVYDDILKTNPDPTTRAAALCGKGAILFASNKSGGTEVFDLVVADSEISSDWKQEALWRRGKDLEKHENPDEALLSYYESMRIGDSDKNSPGGALLWYFKAGFDAARILESRERWPAAVALYNKLAASGAPRSEEAAARAKRLQLEHYLWENPEEPK